MSVSVKVFRLFGPLFFSVSTYGQNHSLESLHTWFDEKTGILNSGLYASQEYIETYQVINDKHRFLGSPNYNIGAIWYRSQPFYQVLMKYDLFKDQVIVSPKGVSGASAIHLNNAHIDSFSLGNRRFIRIEAMDSRSKPLKGFYEILEKSANWGLLKKHRKVDVRKLNRNRVYYEFKEKSEYVLEYNQQYFPIKSRKDLFDVFPLSKDAKRKVTTGNSGRFLSDASVISLLREINVFLSATKMGNGL